MNAAKHPLHAIATVIASVLRGDSDEETRTHLKTVVTGLDDIAWVRLTSRHRVVPILATCLTDLDLMEALPEDFRVYLEMMQAGNAERNGQILDELRLVLARLNALGVKPCLLKGATRLVDGLYPDPSWRFMSDIDLLVPEERLDDCSRILEKEGYQSQVKERLETHHAPPLWDPERAAAVELHWRVRPEPYGRLMPTEDIIQRASPIDGPLGRYQLLHPTDQAILLIAHSQLFNGDIYYGTFRLANLIEMDWLSSTHELDWDRIFKSFTDVGRPRSCAAFLLTANRLLGTPLPANCPADSRTKLMVKRCLFQEYWGPAMTAGIYGGWVFHMYHRVTTMPDQKEARRLILANLRDYKGKFVALRKLIDENL